jgi:HPt (histidine-containing phosphotransfer) domain-containing protein
VADRDRADAARSARGRAIVDYCKTLQQELAVFSVFGEPVRALLDLRPAKAATKRWGWVKKGAPIVIEVGGRDVAGGNVSVIRRDRLYREDGKLDSAVVARGQFVDEATQMLESIQQALHSAGARADGRQYHSRHHRLRHAGKGVRGQQARLGRSQLVEAERARSSTRWSSGSRR